LVEIEWSEVLKEEKSCIQCGKGHLNCDIKKFKDLYDNDKISYTGKIPELIIQKVKEAINVSITYTSAEQSIYTNKRK
jgi:hypothetical protein